MTLDAPEKPKLSPEERKLKAQIAQCKGSLTKTENFLRKQQEGSLEKEAIKTRLQQLDSVLATHKDLSLQLHLLSEENEESDFSDDDFEDRCLTLMSDLRKLLKTQEPAEVCDSSSAMKLPHIDIPVFDGKDVMKYKTFIELFSAVIDKNNKLAPIQKLFYLRKFLKGEPLSLIEGLPVTGDSYCKALELLSNRYDNKFLVITNHVQALLDFPAISKGVSSNLRELVSNSRQHLAALETLGQSPQHWDMLLLPILLRKVDQYTCRAYHSERVSKELPTLEDFFAFLERRACSFEVSQQSEEARHSIKRRDTNYDDAFLSDGTLDPEQNDAENQADFDSDSMPVPNATITSRPQTYNLTIGRSVRLECNIDMKDTVVEWTKDGKTIVKTDYLVGPPSKYDFNKSASSDLIVKSAELSDSGIYRCRLEQGLPAQVEHILVVSEAPIVVNITASPTDRPREGTDLTLTCNVNGSPAPEIKWSVTPLGSSENRNLEEKDGTFTRYGITIKNIKTEQSGTYFCYAFNTVGHNQNKISVFVQGKPRIQVHRTVVNSAINVEATLQCVVHENLPVSITWFKDDNPITSASNTRITTMGTHSNLTVIPVSDADFGTYTCEASCDIGVHSRSIELVQRPVVEELEADGPKLAFKVHSHQKLEDIEVLVKPLTEEGDWISYKMELPSTQNHEYELSYVIQKEMKPGRYEAIVKVKNNKEWSQPSDAAIVDIVNEQPVIQGASVYRGNDASSNRPATVLLSTVLMYLLVRML